MSWEIVAALLCLGACTGFLAGLLGIGGGMVLTPFMTMLLVYVGVPDTAIVHTAIATSLATIMFTSLSSVRAHHKRGAVLWNVVAAMAPGILVGALLGAKYPAFCRLSGFLLSLSVLLVFLPSKCSSTPSRNPSALCQAWLGCLAPAPESASSLP